MEEVKQSHQESAGGVLDQMEKMIGIVPVENGESDPHGVVTGTGVLIGFILGSLLTTILYAWAMAGGLEMILGAV